MAISDHLDLPVLPINFMNDDHALAARQWEEMNAALADYSQHPERLLGACQAFLQHSQEHFAREESAMQAAGFQPYPVHKQEHDRVLRWLQELVDAVRNGERQSVLEGLVRRDVPVWLQQHVQTMDLITARWLAAHT